MCHSYKGCAFGNGEVMNGNLLRLQNANRWIRGVSTIVPLMDKFILRKPYLKLVSVPGHPPFVEANHIEVERNLGINRNQRQLMIEA
jgi:hypothetical protein